MPQLEFSRTTPFTPQQMLDLVSDLKSYPDFVPNCSAMDIGNKSGSPLSACDARMQVNFGPISQSYTSHVMIDIEAKTISAQALDGPFSHLESMWTFLPDGEGSQIGFTIDFGFSNPIISAVAEPAFANIQDEILDAFMAEARRRYA